MDHKLEKKYGLLTAISMVVGIVIGSGVFFKAQDILKYTEGNMPLGILAWIIGGIVIIVCTYNFATLATHYEKVNGLVDYAEATVGSKFSYMVAWFSTFLYIPGMTSVLAWVSARYTVAIFGGDPSGGLCLALAGFYLCASYALNALSPRIAGKFQVSTTFIKLIPLVVMAIVGTAYGLYNGTTVDAFKTWDVIADGGKASGLFAAVVATAFAYEGWIIATSINAELKNAKKNLPIALTVGSIVIVVVYIIYYIGLAGAAPLKVLIEDGANAAFVNLFGNVGGTLFSVLIVISCFGTLNGLMLSSTRNMYSIAVRKQGPKPVIFSEISNSTNMPSNSSIIGLVVCSFWLFYFYGANLMEKPIFGLFSFDSSELPIITLYAFYIPIFINFAKKHGKEQILKNAVMPILGVLCSLFMIFAAFYSHGISKYLSAKKQGVFSFPVLFYLIVFAIIMISGLLFYKRQQNTLEHQKAQEEANEEVQKEVNK